MYLSDRVTVCSKSGFDTELPASFKVDSAQQGSNIVVGNYALGSHRIGFDMIGDACDGTATQIKDNYAQGNMVGMLLRGGGASCTAVTGFTAAFSWDFGLLSMGVRIYCKLS